MVWALSICLFEVNRAESRHFFICFIVLVGLIMAFHLMDLRVFLLAEYKIIRLRVSWQHNVTWGIEYLNVFEVGWVEFLKDGDLGISLSLSSPGFGGIRIAWVYRWYGGCLGWSTRQLFEAWVLHSYLKSLNFNNKTWLSL